MKREIIYLKVPVSIEYDSPTARAHVLDKLIKGDGLYANVVGGGTSGCYGWKTRLKPTLMRKPKGKK